MFHHNYRTPPSDSPVISPSTSTAFFFCLIPPFCSTFGEKRRCWSRKMRFLLLWERTKALFCIVSRGGTVFFIRHCMGGQRLGGALIVCGSFSLSGSGSIFCFWTFFPGFGGAESIISIDSSSGNGVFLRESARTRLHCFYGALGNPGWDMFEGEGVFSFLDHAWMGLKRGKKRGGRKEGYLGNI